MFAGDIPLWRRAPFIRFLFPLMAGIIIQWYWQIPAKISWLIFLSALLASFALFFPDVRVRFRLAIANGIVILVLFVSLGCLLTRFRDIRNNTTWYGKHY